MRFLAPTLLLTGTLALSGCNGMNQWLNVGTGGTAETTPASDSGLLTQAVRQALTLSTTRAADALSSSGGYARSALRLTLPEQLDTVTQTLAKVGLGSYATQIEAAMNTAAERAAGEAKAVFLDSIRTMSVNDALGIATGGATAATDYFRQSSEASLRSRYAPIVKEQLARLDFYSQYDTLLNAYNALPLTTKPNLSLEDYVIDRSLDAMFTRIGQEETQIRSNPVQYGSALIGRFFAPAP